MWIREAAALGRHGDAGDGGFAPLLSLASPWLSPRCSRARLWLLLSVRGRREEAGVACGSRGKGARSLGEKGLDKLRAVPKAVMISYGDPLGVKTPDEP